MRFAVKRLESAPQGEGRWTKAPLSVGSRGCRGSPAPGKVSGNADTGGVVTSLLFTSLKHWEKLNHLEVTSEESWLSGPHVRREQLSARLSPFSARPLPCLSSYPCPTFKIQILAFSLLRASRKIHLASCFCRKRPGKDREAKFEAQPSAQGAGNLPGHIPAAAPGVPSGKIPNLLQFWFLKLKKKKKALFPVPA